MQYPFPKKSLLAHKIECNKKKGKKLRNTQKRAEGLESMRRKRRCSRPRVRGGEGVVAEFVESLNFGAVVIGHA